MRRIALAVVALTVFLPSLAQARARWMTDVELYVREQCCCPRTKLQAPPAQRTVQKTCCRLDRRTAAALPLASETPTAPAVLPLATPSAAVPVTPPLRHVVVAIVPRAHAPPTSTLLAQARALLL